jgi:adenosylcobinamide kinase/adenosylcobinamide-phosphate guanylyltransferase
MERRLILILGGARSGKSSHAENLAAQAGGAVLYVATAEAGDEEMARRIAHHKASRPAHWRTLEAARKVGAALLKAGGEERIVLLDCLTLLANNVIAGSDQELDEGGAQEALDVEVEALLQAYEDRGGLWLIVSNEVGLGLVPPYPLGRAYRDALGRANQRLAAAADEVLFMVAGLPLVVKGGDAARKG